MVQCLLFSLFSSDKPPRPCVDTEGCGTSKHGAYILWNVYYLLLFRSYKPPSQFVDTEGCGTSKHGAYGWCNVYYLLLFRSDKSPLPFVNTEGCGTKKIDLVDGAMFIICYFLEVTSLLAPVWIQKVVELRK